jgi:hypothetical protein
MEEKYLTNQNYRNWKAKWIWGSKESIPHSFYYFRKELEWNGKGRVILDITADTRYRLYSERPLCRLRSHPVSALVHLL